MSGFALVIPADTDRPIRMEPFNHDDTLHWLQGLVDGHIETVPCAFARQDALLICNEDGRLQGLPMNIRAYVAVPNDYDLILGDCVIVSRRGERFTGLTRANAMLISDSIGARMNIIRKNRILEDLIK